jgi:hypothetical protein
MQRDKIPKLFKKSTNRGEEETEDDQWGDALTTRSEWVNVWPNSLNVWWWWWWRHKYHKWKQKKTKAVPLHATKGFGGRGCKAPTHSLPRH